MWFSNNYVHFCCRVIVENKKEFDASEQTVTLDLVNMSNLNSDKDSKYFIGYTDNIIRSLCIVLGQMSK